MMRTFKLTSTWESPTLCEDVIEDIQNFTFYASEDPDTPDIEPSTRTSVTSESGPFQIHYSVDVDGWIDVILEGTFTLVKEKMRLSIAHILNLNQNEVILK